MVESAPKSEALGFTLHLAPEDVWLAQHLLPEYRPEAFKVDGFVHCTDGETGVLAVGNRYYRSDPRSYVVLDVDLSRVSKPAIYEDEARQFPHIYGPIERDAVAHVRRVERSVDGTFLAIGEHFDGRAA